MQPHWKRYWKEMFRETKGLKWALGISFLFYALNFPQMDSHARLLYVPVFALYGVLVFGGVWSAYGLYWAWLVSTRGPDYDYESIRLGLPTHFSLSFTGMALGLLFGSFANGWITGARFSFSGYTESILIGVFISLMFLFHSAYKRTREEALQLQAAKTSSDLHVLKNQMQPHFLFNSLNSLAALIDLDPKQAGEMLQKLSDLYRLILELSKHESASLEQEFRVAELYLELEQLRFGERLKFSLSLHPRLRAKQLPSLVVQTLVENAVKHGIGPSEKGGFVRLEAREATGGWELRVENDGSAPSEGKEGTGLSNTRERLRLLFGSAALTLAHEKGKTLARIYVPEQQNA
jgi:two-component sensor histidine kinase